VKVSQDKQPKHMHRYTPINHITFLSSLSQLAFPSIFQSVDILYYYTLSRNEEREKNILKGFKDYKNSLVSDRE